MAKRSRQSFLKRQRERKRAEKAAAKRLKRQQRRSGELTEGEDDALEGTAGVAVATEDAVDEERPQTADDGTTLPGESAGDTAAATETRADERD